MMQVGHYMGPIITKSTFLNPFRLEKNKNGQIRNIYLLFGIWQGSQSNSHECKIHGYNLTGDVKVYFQKGGPVASCLPVMKSIKA